MKSVLSCTSAVALWGVLLAPVQAVSYTTSTVTECFPNAPGLPTPGLGPAPTGRECRMPISRCGACDCSSCAHTTTYTTSFPAFCASGLTDVMYTVTEVRSGMAKPPVITSRPSVPEGFTVAEETCTVCGDEPITRTMTCPVDGAPYVPVETAVAKHLESAADHKDETDTYEARPSDVLFAAAPGQLVRDAALAIVAMLAAF
ncbi:uncharacterized protein F5Z01DRAFT_639104 [Emericellopsis atlantica]|uniref:Uncharacterized protein n=1 Tax=Emericellopsis atlantica TaxID=2614577 RepID=A0A9P7ZG46_9HYPO|nr:uncharacterized protein F5Z01DRAFT_639104 [Emericellopsis atlantica]KAG9251494.1 hypothetical protein F5Z01DRAFT_639104 [Emericellopsis atlantica]